MRVLVVGATGATGRLLVEQLLEEGHEVRAVVRSPEKLPGHLREHAGLSIVAAEILALSDDELAAHVRACGAVACCLGHTLSFKGIFGHPRRLVTEAASRLCAAIEANGASTAAKFVLMNSAGCTNRGLAEPLSLAHRAVIALLRLLTPPHADNELAGEYLRTEIGPSNKAIEWVVVRPDSLIDAGSVSEYEAHPSPTRSALFDPGKTSRINVAHFMTKLITEPEDWKRWKGQMPVIYNKSSA